MNFLSKLGPGAWMVKMAGCKPQWHSSSSSGFIDLLTQWFILEGGNLQAALVEGSIGSFWYSAKLMSGRVRAKLQLLISTILDSSKEFLWLWMKLDSSWLILWLSNSSMNGRRRGRGIKLHQVSSMIGEVGSCMKEEVAWQLRSNFGKRSDVSCRESTWLLNKEVSWLVRSRSLWWGISYHCWFLWQRKILDCQE